jgi:hypothetical protein
VKRLAAIAVLTAVAATLLLTQQIIRLDHTRVYGISYVKGFEPGRKGLDKTLGLGDGQAYAEIARDPTLARPAAFRFGPHSAAYRFGRPLFGELVWALSLGRPGNVTATMAAVCIVATGAAGAALASLIARRGGNPWLGAGVAFLPGAWSATTGLTSETLALAFGTWGVVLWMRHRRPTPAVVVLFSLAVLTRETMLLVPIALVAWSWHRSRDARRAHLAMVAVPAAVLGAWYVVVYARFDAWPFASGPKGAFGLPFTGIFHALSGWSGSLPDLFALAGGLGLVLLARRSNRNDPLRWIVIAYVVFAPFMGPAVWARWQDFGRPLLPLYAFALVLAAGTAAGPGRDRDTAGTASVEPQVMSSMR